MVDDALYAEALTRLRELITRVRQAGLNEPDAVTLATVDTHGHPQARVVLLRRFDERGVVFFTNALSHKGQHLAHLPRAAICGYWDAIAEQVRITGRVETVSAAESDAYWRGRARESQLGAWASLQSEILNGRETLQARLAQFQQRFAGMEVPRPDHWLGYRVIPESMEFWVSRPGRLHERTVYHQHGHHWTRHLLYP